MSRSGVSKRSSTGRELLDAAREVAGARLPLKGEERVLWRMRDVKGEETMRQSAASAPCAAVLSLRRRVRGLLRRTVSRIQAGVVHALCRSACACACRIRPLRRCLPRQLAFTLLSVEPARCRAVLLCCAVPQTYVVVNGVPVSLQEWRAVPGLVVYRVEPGVFTRWENTVSLQVRFGKTREAGGKAGSAVALCPVFATMDDARGAVLPAGTRWAVLNATGDVQEQLTGPPPVLRGATPRAPERDCFSVSDRAVSEGPADSGIAGRLFSDLPDSLDVSGDSDSLRFPYPQETAPAVSDGAASACARNEMDRVAQLARALSLFVVPPVGTGENAGPPSETEDTSGFRPIVPEPGEVWSFYDPVEAGFRLWGWRWDSGIVLEALAVAGRVLSADAPWGVRAAGKEKKGDATNPSAYAEAAAIALRAARAVGDRMLSCQIQNHGCTGGFPEWVDLRFSEYPYGVSEWVAPFNAAFISAGLLELARSTGEEGYADAARAGLEGAVRQGLTVRGGLAGYYFSVSQGWQYLGQINDSFILPRGLAVLEAWDAEVPAGDWHGVYAGPALRLTEYMLGKAAMPEGYVLRSWFDPEGAAPAGEPLFPEWKQYPERVVEKIFLRGQAWSLFGLVGTYTLLVRAGLTLEAQAIRRHAERLVCYLLQVQMPSGLWLYSQKQPYLGECVKGTAALALALGEYMAATGDALPRSAVRRALDALMVDSGAEVPLPAELAAMPVDRSEEGGIMYFRGRPMVCTYAAALELLARVRFAAWERDAEERGGSEGASLARTGI